MNLKEWMTAYLKSRDAIKQEILGLEEQNDTLIVLKQTGELKIIIKPELAIFDELKTANGPLSIAVHNTKKNVDFLITNWDTFSKAEKLCIYFVNPSTNEKWMLYPHTHNQITEKAALRKGLETMYSEVSPYAA